MASNVRYERRGDVAVITLNRPDRRNAIDFDTGEQLLEALNRLDDEDAAAGIVTGAGDTFCAGGDLKGISDRGTLEGREDGFMGFSHAEPETPLIAAV